MASSMSKSVLGQGSDFIDEDKKQCQPCSVQGNSVAANTVCVDCDSYLCTQCTSNHKALKGTNTHVLIKPDDAKKSSPKATHDKCTRKCSVHPAKTVKYFCVAHSHLGCSVCFTMDHKLCSDVDHIQTVASDIKRHAGFNKFDEDLHTLGTEYKSGLDEIKKDFDHLQEDEKQLRKTYDKFRKGVIDGLDKLEREIFKQAKNIKDDETQKLAALSKNLDKSKSTVDGLIQKLDLLMSSGHKCDAYVLAKTDQKDVTSLREELARAFDGKTYRRYEFRQNVDVTKAGVLGELTTQEAVDRPHSARVRLEPQPSSSKSTVITNSEEKRYENQAGHQRHRRQSIADSSSSEEDTLKESDEGRVNKQRQRENKEMNNCIHLLDNTLQLNREDDRSEEELVEVKVASSIDETPRIPKRVSMLSIDSHTLCNADRLMARISLLHEDCVKGVGWNILKEAYEILGRIEEDEVAPELVALMGKEKFDLYAEKIWQLKFCEDMARSDIPS